ncbi:hypothetical protein FO519_004042 [Halicephalobus sp. NKZ332]|nr:hypothetical protein FO519_004042 [Halicephalobus sp. NKZ332]
MALKHVHFVGKLLQSAAEIESVIINGWVKKEHRKGRWSFLHVSDGENHDTIQVVLPKDVGHNVGVGSAITISGKWTKSGGKQQAMELLARDCRVWCKDEGKINITSVDQIRKFPHLRTKHEAFASLMRMRSKVTSDSHRFFADRGYVHIDTPLISSNDCEGAGETFIIKASNDDDFFGTEDKYLPVSGQLHLEAMTSAFPKVYTLNPTFRAEKSLSRQHLAEFRMLEAEIGFLDNVEILCDEVEDFVRHVVAESNSLVEDKSRLGIFTEELDTESIGPLADVVSSINRFPRLTYSEACKMLEDRGEKIVDGFSKAQELQLVDLCKSPLFILNFPSEQKPFYMKRSSDEKNALCFDFIAPIVGELAGGSIRETDAEKMRSKMDSPSLSWYYELRKRGTPQTGGFGIGFERLIQTLFGIPSIKDVIPFPRMKKMKFYISQISMVKLKRRYFLVEDLSEDGRIIKNSVAVHAIMEKIKELFGDYGAAAAVSQLSRRPIKAPTGMMIFRSSAECAHFVEKALPFVTKMGDKFVQLRLLRKSSTIRGLYLFAWEEHNRRVYSMAADQEKEDCLQTMAVTTGKRVPKSRNKRIWD